MSLDLFKRFYDVETKLRREGIGFDVQLFVVKNLLRSCT